MKTKTLIASAALVLGLPASLLAAPDPAVLANYTKHCASCHGKDGKGQTTMGKKLGCKDLTDKKVVAEIKDELALKNLKEGVKDKDGKEIKKPFAGKLSEAELKALLAHSKAFAN